MAAPDGLGDVLVNHGSVHLDVALLELALEDASDLLEDSEHDLDAAGKIAELRRRRIEEARFDNPFIAAQFIGNPVGAAEIAIRKYIRDGGLDDLEGHGKPLPDGPPPAPYVDPDDARIQRIVDRMTHEKQHVEKGEWRRAVVAADRTTGGRR